MTWEKKDMWIFLSMKKKNPRVRSGTKDDIWNINNKGLASKTYEILVRFVSCQCRQGTEFDQKKAFDIWVEKACGVRNWEGKYLI